MQYFGLIHAATSVIELLANEFNGRVRRQKQERKREPKALAGSGSLPSLEPEDEEFLADLLLLRRDLIAEPVRGTQ